MTITGLIFWILMAVLLLAGGLLGGVQLTKAGSQGRVHLLSGGVIVWVLLALLGWQTFKILAS